MKQMDKEQKLLKADSTDGAGDMAFRKLYVKTRQKVVRIINANETYKFSSAKSVVVSGDIHGDFNRLVFKMCVQYAMRDTLLIVAGDCGFGFESRNSYEDMAKRNSKRLSEANNWIVFVRGNHDNPAYFDGETFHHRRMMCVPNVPLWMPSSSACATMPTP